MDLAEIDAFIERITPPEPPPVPRTRKAHRNTPERASMLAERRSDQCSREPGFTRMSRKPRGHIGKWDPANDKQFFGRPRSGASLNRWTGMPHEHARAKARHLQQLTKRRTA